MPLLSNLYGFLLCGVDKARAVKHKSAACGAFGARFVADLFDRRLFWDILA